ncbi:MAG: hypothetical protein GQ527_10880 [Bacteroidales bacterium]|nr:hypothetical protein [Bacteroidales bacterium]
MKWKVLIIVLMQCVFYINVAYSQVPNNINFQAVAQLNDGNLIKDQTVTILVQITQDNLYPTLRYGEVHQVTTNSLGHFNLKIGSGEIEDGSFDDIQWEHANVKLNLEIDITGGVNFTPLGSTELLTVPYAFYAGEAATLVSADCARVSYCNELVIGDEEIPDIYANGEGKIGIGTRTLDTDERKDIELGVDKRLWGYSTEFHLDKSGVFNLQAMDSVCKPAVVWYDPSGGRQAAIVAHIKSAWDGSIHNHWSIETTNEAGELHTRMEFPLDRDWTTIETHGSDFKVGDGGTLISGGDLFGYGTYKFGFGDKDWDMYGLFGNAKWEFYRSTNSAQLLLHQGDGSKNAELLLKKGNNEWNISNRVNLEFRFNNNELITFLPNNNVGIGISNPTSRLHVDGDVKITSGHSYLTEGGDFAEYFQSEALLSIGDIVGINLDNGLARKYQNGDALLGIASDDAGFVGNINENREDGKSRVLVGLVGQLVFNDEQAIVKNGIVYTNDMQKIGILLASGKVFIRMN